MDGGVPVQSPQAQAPASCGAGTRAGGVNAPIHAELPFATMLLNGILRMHWRERTRYQRKLAWDLRIALHRQIPPTPLVRVRLRIERRSTGMPDFDGMVGGYKHLIDCLLPMSPRHPVGLGVIADDNPACVTADYPPPVRALRGAECTLITIWDLTP